MTASPWPATASFGEDGLSIGGVTANELAERFGTPLWVVDETDLRRRCRDYREAFGGCEVAYASKAWPTVAVVQIVAAEGLWIDIASGGELHTARVAGVAGERLIFHGNNKSPAELVEAVAAGVGRIVVDNLTEIDNLERIGAETGSTIKCWLRVTPGIDAHTHEYVRTGHDDTKFGFTLSLGLADAAVERAAASPHIDVVGAHAHIGSQIFGADAFVANAEVMMEARARWRRQFGVELAELNLGGGMGIRYTHEDHPVTPSAYAEAILAAVSKSAADHGEEPPRLFVEPGRAIVGPSTITLYRVGDRKDLPGLRSYVAVDGGMSDNIRPALYQAEHEVALGGRASEVEARPMTVVGKHCESGDIIAERVSLPADLRPGDLLAVAATGAYTEAMASNYNRLPRPGAVRVADGVATEMIRRETYADVVRRDVPL